MDKVNVCGVQIDNVSMAEAVEQVKQLVLLRAPSMVVTPNVDHLVRLSESGDFRRVYTRARLVLADGMPLVWAARWMKTPLKEKVSGSDLFPKICEMCAQEGFRVFLLGGREGAAVGAATAMQARFPDLQVVGTHSPPFGFEKDTDYNRGLARTVKASGADILFVGLGSPKQELWIDAYCEEYLVPVSIGVGVTFEFFAGMVRRSPVWMQKAGLEWLWRLMMEPQRLWKRYLVDDMKFAHLLLAQLSAARKGRKC